MRTALITGASDGIGKAIALALSKQEEYLILFGSQREKVADS
ncbi:SDR family NAD(P)-dependent oxidoreductase [Candidatus Saccharibacteria bacterium]|jgi:short-subunit dehydrogenase|nr:SDR family NAD(P)-dependent oxidoreductase [Candidatus Saccharibacteria bacterium]